MRNTPQLKILVTSRERLNLQAEWRLEVEGLPYPTANYRPPTADPATVGGLPSAVLETYTAIQLFAQSAQRVHVDFSLEAEWAGTLRICQLTRGMPLAIELAAAGARDFACAAIAAEIERNLSFLATTMRDLPERHRSVRAVFDHSWNLLREEEHRAFIRLAVFRGGFDAEAAEQIADAAHALLTALVAKSLLRQDGSGRYEMHELLRQYAQEKLEETGEAVAVRRLHLTYYMTLTEQAHQELFGGAQETWLARLEVEHDNIRAAFAWAIHSQESQAGLRLAVALRRFSLTRGDWVEGMRWLAQVLAINNTPSPVRTQALNAAGNLAVSLGDYEHATALYEEALTQSQEQGDKAVIAGIFNNLGLLAKMQGKYARAEEFQNASLALRRELGDNRGIASSLLNLGNVVFARDDYGQAAAFYQQSLDLHRELQDIRGIAIVLGNLGNAYSAQGDCEQAKNYYTESLALSRKLNGKPGIANILTGLGLVARRQGEYTQAATLYAEGLTLAKEVGDRHQITALFEGLSGLACAQGEMERATRLRGAAEALREAIGDPQRPFDLIDDERDLAALRASLGEEAFAARWAEGKAMSLEQAIQSAMQQL